MELTPDLLKTLYRYLVTTRTLENRVATICQSQNANDPLIVGKGYLSTGQEAISVGASVALRQGDWLAVGHRDMGAHLVRGITPQEIFAQYFCRATSLTQGRDENIHFGCTEKKILGFISHMGASACVANGLAAAMKYRGDPNFVLTTFGDGASSQGIVHESLNYAAVFKLPVVFIINNNRYAISTPVQEQFTVKNLSDRAAGYGIPGMLVDGNDVVAVYQNTLKAREHVLAGKGPVLMECKTMRMCGHGTHDSAGYVPRDEIAAWEKRDPLLLMKERLVKEIDFTEEVDKKLNLEVNELIEAAWQAAAKGPAPRAEDLLTGVYTEVNDGRNDLRRGDTPSPLYRHGR